MYIEWLQSIKYMENILELVEKMYIIWLNS